jgi:hypothetical protein
MAGLNSKHLSTMPRKWKRSFEQFCTLNLWYACPGSRRKLLTSYVNLTKKLIHYFECNVLFWCRLYTCTTSIILQQLWGYKVAHTNAANCTPILISPTAISFLSPDNIVRPVQLLILMLLMLPHSISRTTPVNTDNSEHWNSKLRRPHHLKIKYQKKNKHFSPLNL